MKHGVSTCESVDAMYPARSVNFGSQVWGKLLSYRAFKRTGVADAKLSIRPHCWGALLDIPACKVNENFPVIIKCTNNPDDCKVQDLYQ